MQKSAILEAFVQNLSLSFALLRQLSIQKSSRRAYYFLRIVKFVVLIAVL